ncbi:MAG: hypothetical protein INQ03_19585 [Candidatus Heimdallarchaeota archaeon]|nr:hypothetical protein [Candidatus Heimdallarchaeota archaeon]
MSRTRTNSIVGLIAMSCMFADWILGIDYFFGIRLYAIGIFIFIIRGSLLTSMYGGVRVGKQTGQNNHQINTSEPEKCSGCGTINASNSKFCIECGASMSPDNATIYTK